MRRVRAAGLLLAAVLLMGATANDPAERLADPVKEARARALFREVRCVVCQNESIDDSEADLADDLRKVVRAQVAAGRSDSQVKRYLTDRYGEFVLLKPPFSPENAMLWLTPFAIVIGGGAILILRARKPPATPPLSIEEEAALAALIVADRGGPGQGSAA
jgi:cytochrome c-type biogenesis protein CcmH